MPAVSLTDHGSMAGAVQLFKATRGTGVKPVIGCEVYVADDRRAQTKGYAHLTLLAADNAGYSNLIKLSSLGYLEGYYYKPRVDWELLERHARRADRALRLPLGSRLQGARRRAARATPRPSSTGSRRCSARDDVYVELQNAHLDVQARILPAARRSSRPRPGLPTVATGDVHYLRHEDARAHEALLCIQSGDSLKNPNHWKFDTDHFFFKTPAEMAADFPGHEDALRRTLEVAERCNVEIELGRILLPQFPVPDGRDAFDFLVELCEKGLQKRYGDGDARADRAAPVRAEDDQGDGVHRLLPDRLGLHPLREAERRSASARAAARPPAASSPTASRSPTSTRSATTSCSSASSTPAARRCPTWTSTSPSPAASASSTTSPRSTAATASRRSSPSRRWPPAPPSATPAACSRSPYGVVDKIAKLIPEGPGQTLDECLKPGAELRRRARLEPGREGDRRPRPAARGADARRLDPRRRRRDRRRAADERRAAAAEGRRPGGRDAVPDGRRRGARPAEDGLPRPAQPRRDRQGGRARRATSTSRRSRWTTRRPTRCSPAARRPASSSSSRRACARRSGR